MGVQRAAATLGFRHVHLDAVTRQDPCNRFERRTVRESHHAAAKERDACPYFACRADDLAGRDEEFVA